MENQNLKFVLLNDERNVEISTDSGFYFRVIEEDGRTVDHYVSLKGMTEECFRGLITRFHSVE